MKKVKIFFALVLMASVLLLEVIWISPASAADVPANPLQKDGWVLDRNDEFNGTSLDTSLWIPSYLSYRTTEERAAARYSFRNGCLVLRIDKDQPTYYANGSMKVSSIQTGQKDYLHKDDFNHSTTTKMLYTPKQGYFEIRAKTVNQSGYHCAFWTVGKRDTSSQEAEIDIIEQYGKDGRYRFNLIGWDDPNISDNTYDVGLNITSSSEFHIYGLEWDENSLKFYVDNQLKRTVNQAPDYPAVFFLSIYENSGSTGTADTNSSLYPREFIVDYFRAYKKADSSSTIKYEAENLSRTLSSGVTSEVWNDGASGGGWVKVNSDSTGDYVDFTVNVPKAGNHKVVTGYRSASTRGIAQLSINGTDHGSPIDMYQSSATFKEATTDNINFGTAGNKTFRYRITGKNSSSSNYSMGIDYIKLVPSDTSQGSYVKLRNRATNLNIDGYGLTSNGSVCNQYGNSSSNNQQWTIEQSGSYVRIKNRATGLYLDSMGRTTNGSNCGQWGNSSSSNQQWIQESAGSGYYKFKNRATGLYLDGMGRTSNGSALGQWVNSSSNNQQWLIVNP